MQSRYVLCCGNEAGSRSAIFVVRQDTAVDFAIGRDCDYLSHLESDRKNTNIYLESYHTADSNSMHSFVK